MPIVILLLLVIVILLGGGGLLVGMVGVAGVAVHEFFWFLVLGGGLALVVGLMQKKPGKKLTWAQQAIERDKMKAAKKR